LAIANFCCLVDWHELVNAAQGDNQEEVECAQRMVCTRRSDLECCCFWYQIAWRSSGCLSRGWTCADRHTTKYSL